jgi:hypothetical protein
MLLKHLDLRDASAPLIHHKSNERGSCVSPAFSILSVPVVRKKKPEQPGWQPDYCPPRRLSYLIRKAKSRMRSHSSINSPIQVQPGLEQKVPPAQSQRMHDSIKSWCRTCGLASTLVRSIQDTNRSPGSSYSPNTCCSSAASSSTA